MTLRKSMKGMESFWMCGLQGKIKEWQEEREKMLGSLTYDSNLL